MKKKDSKNSANKKASEKAPLGMFRGTIKNPDAILEPTSKELMDAFYNNDIESKS